MSSIDLRHAYYSVHIAEEHQKYLCFKWGNKIFQYTCLPNGLASAPRLFTKLMKPVFSHLRSLGYINIGYIDDSLLCGDSEAECQMNVQETVQLMENLGFMIHKDKSVFKPTKQIAFLGNIIDSEKMMVFLPKEKQETIKRECQSLCSRQNSSIREVARVIGLIVSSFSAVDYGKLFYRSLEKEKIKALKISRGNFDASMAVTAEMKQDLTWWIENINSQYRIISRGPPDITIQTDASLSGWGAVFDLEKIGGRWSEYEQEKHINYLEMLAIWFALKSFKDKVYNKHVKILSDNSTAVSYINNMGGCKSQDCNQIAKEIWIWCIGNKTWISCTHIPGKSNVDADFMSRNFNDQLEWKLSENIFKSLVSLWGEPVIDLFASRMNNQLQCYCSWKADPFAEHVNAFLLDWGNFKSVYLFPPFSLLSSCTQKLRMDRAKGIIIAPLWPTQPWFTQLMQLLVDKPILIRKEEKLLYLPYKNVQHPLEDSLILLACLVSGDSSDNKAFLDQQPEFSCLPGNQVLRSNTHLALRNGFNTVVKGKLIQFNLL